MDNNFNEEELKEIDTKIISSYYSLRKSLLTLMLISNLGVLALAYLNTSKMGHTIKNLEKRIEEQQEQQINKNKILENQIENIRAQIRKDKTDKVQIELLNSLELLKFLNSGEGIDIKKLYVYTNTENYSVEVRLSHEEDEINNLKNFLNSEEYDQIIIKNNNMVYSEDYYEILDRLNKNVRYDKINILNNEGISLKG